VDTSSSGLDYELDTEVRVDHGRQLKAMADPLRSQILDLVLDRAASVTELADAVGRPKSSVAYHVDVLVDAGLLKVVRTRKVRAIEERFYGRVARTIVYDGLTAGTPGDFLAEAFAETRSLAPEEMSSTLRHVRISGARAKEFFERVAELAVEFSELPREGEEAWAFLAAVYRSDHPTLPPRSAAEGTGGLS
jgi:DNA-binding transcriptional ArsR family regulator